MDKTDPDNAILKGVQYIQNGESKTVTAGKEVVVCTGVMESVKILELPSIGSANLLKSLGVDVVIDNPYAGENLQDHPINGAMFAVRDEY